MAPLREEDLAPDPLVQFRLWYAEAGTDAVAVATADPDGWPAARMVLLRGFDEKGFRFYTNYEGAKAAALEANPRAALLFHWPPSRQVRIVGTARRTTPEESDVYWYGRPRGSRLGAWASPQSRVIAGREELERRLAEVESRFAAQDVPRPSHWGGYRVTPSSYEFWHHQDDRLHDRIRYRREAGGWVKERLAP